MRYAKEKCSIQYNPIELEYRIKNLKEQKLKNMIFLSYIVVRIGSLFKNLLNMRMQWNGYILIG